MEQLLIMIRAVLWDMDGVISDTGEIHFQAWQHVFTPLGIEFTRDNFRHIFGMNNTTALSLIFDPGTEMGKIHQIDLEKEAKFRELAQGSLQLLPGVKTWLMYFKQAGIHQAIASSAPQQNIDVILEELKIRTYFDTVVSGAQIPGKPNPDVFLAAAQAFGAPPSSCVVVEDSVAGIEAANRAGMKCIAITTTSPAAILQGASLVLHSLEDLAPDQIESRLWPAKQD